MQSGLFKLQDWYRMVPYALLAFALGFWGFERCAFDPLVGHASCPASGHWQDWALQAVSLVRPNFQYLSPAIPWQLVVAAILFPSLVFVGAFNVAVNNLRRDMRVVSAQRKRNHMIVCGLGHTGKQIVNSFRDAGLDVVAVTLDPSSPEALSCEKRGVPVIAGDATQPSILKFAGLVHAKSLVITCGSDSKNVEIGMRARAFLEHSGKRGNALRILPEMRSGWLYDTVVRHRGSALGSAQADFQLFNLDAIGARAMLQSAAFTNAIRNSRLSPRLLFAGFGQMGSEVLVQAALCNFALPGHRMSATVLDERGEICAASIETKCAHIDKVADLKLLPCSFALDDTAARDTIKKLLREDPAPHAVIVALATDDVALHATFEFRRCLDHAGLTDIPVFVRLREKQRLGAFLSGVEGRSGSAERLCPFGDLGQLTKPGVLVDEAGEALARATHEAFLKFPADNMTANVPWVELSEQLKQQNRDFANHIPIKLNQLGFGIEGDMGVKIVFSEAEVETLAAIEHWRWSLVLKAHGWHYGKVRDPFRRLHPLLMDWSDLDEKDKNTSRNMVRRIPEIVAAARLGMRTQER